MRGNSNDHENIWYDSRLINEFEDIHQQKKKKKKKKNPFVHWIFCHHFFFRACLVDCNRHCNVIDIPIA